MDISSHLRISYYKNIASLNEEHQIYLVQHVDTQKIYVKKIINLYNIDVYRKLYSEPVSGTPRIIEMAEDDSELTVIEEYIAGKTLEELISEKALNLEKILDYIFKICSVLNRLHTKTPPIVHRDIKPSNIIITPNEDVVLLDFNAAKYSNPDSSGEDTVLLGTKGYAAPEQYGFGSSTPQTDIYALGILLKEMMLSCDLNNKQLEQIIKRCTAMEPSARYADIPHLERDIRNILKNITETEEIAASYKHPFAPPGFRSGKVTNAFASIIVYLIIGYFSLTLTSTTSQGFEVWLERIFMLLASLSVVLISCNYLNIWKKLPICRSRSAAVRFVGVLLWDVCTVIVFLSVLMLADFLFFNL